MPHITAQCMSAETRQFGHGHAPEQGKSKRNGKSEGLASPSMRLDLRGLSAKALMAVPDANLSSSRSPHIQKFNILPTTTPTSTASAIFDSPQKSSPTSSVSSTNPLAIVQRANTPIAELEDTSPAYTCQELEDTSNHAIRSRVGRNLSSYTLKSTHSTARSLISVVDQQFADYEAEIRFLRQNLAEAENSLRDIRRSLSEAKEAADDSNHALDAAQEAIADRDYEIEIKKNVIAEFEKDVKHCQEHHSPPTPPSKWRGSDGAVSRFNVDTNRSPKSPGSENCPTTLSPSLIGRPFATSPNSSSEGSSTVSAPKTPRSTFVTPSGAPSPPAGGSPLPKSHRRSQGHKSSSSNPLTSEALASALSSAAGPSKNATETAEGHVQDENHMRESYLKQSLTAKINSSTVLVTQKPHYSSRRAMESSASIPNLRNAQNMSPRSDIPALPPRLPMMSGGLGIVEGPVIETQEQKLRKKRGALGDLFRRKDQGDAIGDDMIRRKEHGSTIMGDMVHALDYCGI